MTVENTKSTPVARDGTPLLPSREGKYWLDVGCGSEKIEGSNGIDKISLAGVDVVHDLNVVPWPFDNDVFDHVVCKHSLSHLNDLVGVLEEIHRITKQGGIVEILAPHYASDNFNTDPTHKIHMGIRSMNYFCAEYQFKYQYYSVVRFKMLQRRISFRENVTDFRKNTKSNIARFVGLEWLINKFSRVYERFFVYWIPPSEIYFKMGVIK